MRKIIKNREIVDDSWIELRAAEGEDAAALTVPAGKVIVPLATWQAQAEALATRRAAGDIGVWFASDERAETLQGELDKFAVVAVDFPKFTDGRGMSTAYNLRMRLGYTGELRAIGDVLRDQLFSMQRVGFNAFATRQDRSIEDALKGLSDFSETYSASVDQHVPLFRRHARGVQAETLDLGAGI